ncbi:MAG TPA: hypothetical protein VGG10_15260 [Rhizomicrobium sp.]|jgi:hypothetical protein
MNSDSATEEAHDDSGLNPASEGAAIPDAAPPPLREVPIAPLPVGDDTGPTAPMVDALVAVPVELMTEAEFADFFIQIFPAVGHVVGLYYPPPLQTLVNVPKMENARAAAGALYRIAKSSPYMQWLIDKDQMHLKDGIILLGFGASLSYAVVQEVKARRATPINKTETTT